MKVNAEKTLKKCSFDELDPGEVFEFQGEIWIKIEKVVAEAARNKNAVSLELGDATKIFDSATVYPVDGKFEVDGYRKV